MQQLLRLASGRGVWFRDFKCALLTTLLYMKTAMSAILQLPRRIFRFYADGFRSMTVGRKLWAIIIIKLIVIFGILKLFFFPDLLKSRYDNDRDRAEAVRTALTGPRR